MKLKIEYRKPEDLKDYENNSRMHSDDQIERVKKSIEEFGFLNPILIDEDDTIVGGHARKQASIRLGLEEVPTIRTTHLTEEQIRAYIIADNRLAELSEWDNTLLNAELDWLDSVGFDVDIIGFDDILDDIEVKEYPDIEDFESFDEEELEHECPKCGYQFD